MPDAKDLMPRDPQRARGKARFESLLDSVDTLLRDREPRDITIQEVALHANVPLASVYHYFPNNAALLIGAARRYVDQIDRLQSVPLGHEGLRVWTDICRFHSDVANQFYTDFPVAMKLFFGADGSPHIRAIDLEANLRVARRQLAAYRRHFILPEGDHLVDRCAIALGISDSVLTLSYSRHRRITNELLEEAWQARIAYLRLYLPERAVKRSAPLS
jgi:AcrR family transcriptional regulator